MTPDDPQAIESRTVSKFTFGCLVFATTLVLWGVALAIVFAVRKVFGVAIGGSWIGGLGYAFIIFARVGVDGVLKRYGLSRSGRTLEVRAKTGAPLEEEFAGDTVVEIGVRPTIVSAPARVLLGACLCILVAYLLLLPSLATDLKIVFVGTLALFLLIMTNLWRIRKPHARTDRYGVTGRAIGYFSRQFVPWSAIAVCEIETIYDTFGKPVIIRPTLKGHDGQVLMTLSLINTRIEDQERLIKSIKARLPKPVADPWE